MDIGLRNPSLLTLIAAPTVWALHFLVCYVGAAIWCAKPALFGFGFSTLRLGIGGVTVAALAAIVWSAHQAWRNWGFGAYDPPHAAATETDRRRFLGFATLLVAGLSAVATLYVAMVAVFVPGCY